MKLKGNQKGMSLVEIVIVMAVIGILAGASVSMLSYVILGNTKRITKTISTTIEKQQANAMSKSGVPYLYIYKRSDGFYMKTLIDTDITDSSDAKFAQLDDSGTKLSADNVTISRIAPADASGSLIPVTETSFIKIVYRKSGVFDSKTNAGQIVIDGSGIHTITLVQATGKHIVE